MKLYVDELPKSCLECPCFNKVNGRCQIDNLYMDTDSEPIECPLQPLSDYTKQVRKEVCEELRKTLFEYLKVNSMEELENLSLLDSTLTYDVITDKLDQIQGEQ